MKNLIFIALFLSLLTSCKKNDDPKPVDKSVSYKITIVNNTTTTYKLVYITPDLSSYTTSYVNANSTFVLAQTFPNGSPAGDDQKIYVYQPNNTLWGTIYWNMGSGNGTTITWN